MELVYNKSKPVAVTGMAFPTGDVNNYVVGSEEGTVYTASRHGRWVKCFVLITYIFLARPLMTSFNSPSNTPFLKNQ